MTWSATLNFFAAVAVSPPPTTVVAPRFVAAAIAAAIAAAVPLTVWIAERFDDHGRGHHDAAVGILKTIHDIFF